MAAAVQFELQGSGSNFVFAVEGGYFPSLVAEYKAAANPPQIIGLRETWEIRGARLVSADDTTASLWSQWVALRARLATRTTHPTYARFVIPGGATLHTLGPSTHEEFRVEVFESPDTDEHMPASQWRRVLPVTLRVSAVQKFADTNGIVGWEQEVEHSYPDGRHRLSWRTRITTAEGTSAVSKAQSYAAIDVSTLSGTYLYTEDTNGPYGVSTATPDADEENSRTATVCDAVSTVQAFNVTMGTVTPGASPSEVTYSVTVRISETERSTTTSASARGPGSSAYVASKAPVTFTSSEIVDEQALGIASGVWTLTEKLNNPESEDAPNLNKLSATITGGGQALDYEPLADDGDPVEFVGARTAAMATVTVSMEAVGDTFTPETLKLPGAPGDPWRLDHAASSETDPVLDTPGAQSAQNKWTRSATLVYRAARMPSASSPILAAIRAAAPVASHLYRS